jgi:hypothetical protein
VAHGCHREGGAAAVIAMLVYFYRRDWKTLTEYWQQQNTLLMEIVRTNVQELAKTQEIVRLMQIENRADAEAIRSRIHEVAQPVHAMSASIALLVQKLAKSKAGSSDD